MSGMDISYGPVVFIVTQPTIIEHWRMHKTRMWIIIVAPLNYEVPKSVGAKDYFGHFQTLEHHANDCI